MNLALAITLGSVAVGGALAALVSGGRVWLGVLRTFAITAVATLAAVQLLPEAVAELGPFALLVFIAALALPPAFAALLRRVRGRSHPVTTHGVGVELGYFGFVAHQLVEGLALGAYSEPQTYGHDHVELVLAVAAHTVPLTALFIGNTLASRGGRPALRRVAALVLASATGFAAAGWVTDEIARAAAPTLAAAIAGFLCHVLLHGVQSLGRRSRWVRLLEVAAVVGGIALPVSSMHSHDEGGGLHDALLHAWIELTLETAPMLLLGLVLGALLQVWGTRVPTRWLRSGSVSRQALRGIAMGAPLPLCACGVLPIAEGLRKRGATAALVLAFLISTPELGPETLALTVRFMGWPFAIVRLAAAVGLAYVAAIVFARLVSSNGSSATSPAGSESRSVATSASESAPASADASRADASLAGEPPTRGTLASALRYFDELLLHTAPWTMVGLLAAAYIEVAFAPDALVPLANRGLDIVVVAVIALPTYVCAASATPLAAVLLLKGVSPGAVLVGLLLGPATNVATVAVLSRAYGRRAAWLGVAVIGVCACAIGVLVNALGVQPTLPSELETLHEHGLVSWIAIVVLAGLLTGQLWRWGLGPWLSILDAGGHAHGQDHGTHADGAHDHHAHDHHAHDHHAHDHHAHDHHAHDHGAYDHDRSAEDRR